MALTSLLEFGNNSTKTYTKPEYIVKDCYYEFDRPYNDFRLGGAVRCQRLELVIDAPEKEDTELFNWFNSHNVKSGRITLKLAGDTKNNADEVQVMFFEDAICFSLGEEYDVNTSRLRQLRLGMMADELILGNVLLAYTPVK